MEMKKIYVLQNTDNGCIFAASKTKTNLKEEMCDMFMENFKDECQEAVDEHWINLEEPTEEDRIFLRQTWNSLLSYYNQYIHIERINVI